MKNLLILCLLSVIPLVGTAQKTKSIKKFYRQYKKGKDTKNFILPGFLIRLGTGIARDMVQTEEEYEMLKIARTIRQARILFSEDFNPVPKNDFKQLVKNVRQQDNFDDLIGVRTSSVNLQVMIKEKGEKIKGLLVLVNEEDSFFMLHLKTKLKYKDINRIIQIFRDEIPIKQPEKEVQPSVPIV